MMADERYTLKPLTNEDGKRIYRLEIDEFLADNEMTNLFLIALAELQKDSLRLWNREPDWLTYYSVAGIHGNPTEEWNGYPNNSSKIGYCHHSKNTFPTWHRPYMFLFESLVHDEMVKQANACPNENERKVYLDAAARFRLPYWDIIMPRNEEQTTPPPGKDKLDPRAIWGCPEILKAKTVFVKLPNGDPIESKDGFWTINNPLALFTFPNDQEYAKHPKRKQLVLEEGFNTSQTARVPTPRSKNETDNDAVDQVIQRQATAAAILVWQMLNPDEKQKAHNNEKVEILINEERSWETFANDQFREDKIKGNYFATVSLESFHNGIHLLLGTGKNFRNQSHLPPELQSGFQGHMGHPSFAAFDPIFFLHHNNIERLLALHQAMHPEKYTSAQDSKIELFPFMTGEGRKCYTSKDSLIKNYWGSGFAIPGEKELSRSDAIDLIRKYLTDNYYWATNLKRVSGSLKGWPKKDNIAASWALHGPKAVPNAPVLHLKALAVKAGVPELVARDIPLEADASAVKDKVIKTSEVLEQVRAVDSSLPEGALEGPVAAKEPSSQVTWNAHVRVRKFAFNGSFSIHLFIGHVKDDQPERYMTKMNEAGFTGIFASPADSGCASCERNQEEDILVEDVVPLTTILYDYLDASPGSDTLISDAEIKTIPNLEPESVVPFLTENLQWRMIDLGSNLLVGQEQQAKLEIKVSSRPFLPPTQENLMGAYGPYTQHPEITRTKPGGAGYTY